MILKNIGVKYDRKIVFNDFTLEIPDKKITCIMGPSGCGKTTLLNVICGSVPYSGKTINTGKVSYIFQDPTLIPSFTVEKNLDFILKTQIKNKSQRKKIINDMLKNVGLEKEAKNYPHTLSGGMAQRVSLARAFCYPSERLLMDEPFKGLDISIKKQILSLFMSLYRQNERTVVFVTHDIDEAILLGDKIVVLGNNAVVGEFICDVPHAKRTVTSLSDIKEKIYRLL